MISINNSVSFLIPTLHFCHFQRGQFYALNKFTEH